MIARFENFLESGLEGLFKKAFPRPLEPNDLAKALYKQMMEQRLKSIKYVYVPNYYLIRLNPLDYQGFVSYQRSLLGELAEHLEKKANDRQYHLLQPLEIQLDFDNEIPKGRIRVFGRLQEVPRVSVSDNEILPQSNENIEQGNTIVYSQGTGKDLSGNNYQWAVEVTEGLDKGKFFPLTKFRNLIGRQVHAEVSLLDPGVSRHHAQLEILPLQVLLTDLGSTNGTLYEGEVVETALLDVGDEFRIGNTNLSLQEIGS